MHRLRSRHSVFRFKTASWLLVCKWLLIACAIGLLLYSLIAGERRLSLLAFGLGAASVLVGVVQWVLSVQARCPLCLTPPIAHRRCSRHRSAKRLFGSYRFRVACAVIFQKHFRCPYCGEWTAVDVRVNHHRRSHPTIDQRGIVTAGSTDGLQIK